MVPWERWFIITLGITLAIVGVVGVPLAVTEGNLFRAGVFTVMLFGGIGILGYAARD